MRIQFFCALLVAALPAIAADELTVYELLAPGTHQFKITYDVTATREGASYFFNPIRQGAVATEERVIERSTGTALSFDTVGGPDARASGLVSPTTPDELQFIRVHLSVPVPKNGETRIRIFKTYTNPSSYYEKDGILVFDRPFGIRRDIVVLPARWELTGSASPAIVSTQGDGRIRLSFVNDRDDQLPVKITARRLP